MTTPWQMRIPVLPTLITLASLLCGFGAIVTATMPKEVSDLAARLGQIELAAWLILIAMVFDAMDGRVARMSHQVTEFGGELDSLCDAVSFGIAPAVVAMAVLLQYYSGDTAVRLCWAACAVFAVCAVIRLARFNVANKPDEESHRSFQGLPSPSAAGMIASFVILHVDLAGNPAFASFDWVGKYVLPALLVTVGPLMISRVRYVHLIGELTRGERSFKFFIGLVFLIFLVVILKEYIIPVIFSTYLLSGLVGVAIDKVLDRIDLAHNRDSFAG